MLGEDETTKPQAYIGETENFKELVKDNENKKAFWQKALVFVSKDAEMTKSDVQYLEYKAIEEAKRTNNFILSDNKQVPKMPNLPEYQKNPMDEFFEDVKFLTLFIGCNIFKIIQYNDEHLFYIKKGECNAKGFYGSKGFTVLMDSIIDKKISKSFTWQEKLAKIISEYTSKKGDIIVMTSDKTFSSPSTATSFCLGRSSNGWTEWKDENNNTLDSVYRNQ